MNYELVKNQSGTICGLWVSDPELRQNRDLLNMLLIQENASMDLCAAARAGKYRVVPNTFNNAGGYFIMFGSTLAPGEKTTTAAKMDGKQFATANTWFQRGVAAVTAGHYQEALKCFDSALELQSGSAEAWNNKGFVLANLNRNEEAISCCDKAIEINPRYSDPWDIKGRMLGRLGRIKEAMDAIEKFIELAPPEYSTRVQEAKRALQQLEAKLVFKKMIVISSDSSQSVEEKKKQESWWKRLFGK